MLFRSQHLEELDPSWRVIEAVEKVALRVELGDGREVTASSLCERLGFDFDGQQRLVRDLSGGERRRLQLTRLLMESPNVLLLDEPTNDFDVETLAALEDLLDSFAGVLIVISHDRYFIERSCNRYVGLLGDETLRDLPRGVDEYLERRELLRERTRSQVKERPISSAAEDRLVKKELAKVEKQMSKLSEERTLLLERQGKVIDDHEELMAIDSALKELESRITEIESKWLELSDKLE